MNAYIDCTALLDDPVALREFGSREGYFCFRNLLPKEDIDRLRFEFTAIIGRQGWLEAGTTPFDAFTSKPPVVEGEDAYWPVMDEFQRLETFHTLAHHQRILQVYDHLFGERAFVHPRNIGRILFPNASKFTTPAHQDFIHIQGTENAWTTWIPLGDCPVSLGGLAILPRSHKSGIFPIYRTVGAGNVGIDEASMEGEWVHDSLTAGSVLMFHSHTVHKGMPNHDPRRIRLSVDYRYQPISGGLVKGSLEPHWGRQNWPTIYADWKSLRFQYYWEREKLNLVPYDTEMYNRYERPALAAATT